MPETAGRTMDGTRSARPALVPAVAMAAGTVAGGGKNRVNTIGRTTHPGGATGEDRHPPGQSPEAESAATNRR